MDEVVRQIFLFFVSAISLAAFFVVLQALFPRRLARTRSVAEAMPGRAFVTGLVNFLFFGGIAVALFGLADRVDNEVVRAALSIPALVFLLVLSAGLSLGLGGVVLLVGDRLAARGNVAPLDGDGGPGWKRTAAGALALGLACLMPFAGWFVLLPFVALVGLGALVLGFAMRHS